MQLKAFIIEVVNPPYQFHPSPLPMGAPSVQLFIIENHLALSIMLTYSTYVRVNKEFMGLAIISFFLHIWIQKPKCVCIIQIYRSTGLDSYYIKCHHIQLVKVCSQVGIRLFGLNRVSWISLRKLTFVVHLLPLSKLNFRTELDNTTQIPHATIAATLAQRRRVWSLPYGCLSACTICPYCSIILVPPLFIPYGCPLILLRK